MPTAVELDLLRAADEAMDAFERATTSRNAAEIVKARRRLEDTRTELEKLRENTEALDAIRKSLQRPVDAATGALLAKSKAPTPGHRVIDHRHGGRFDKLMRPPGRDALVK
jgi:hypothetical protein